MAILELDKVEKHFGGLAAVNGVTMKADDGEILAIVGPNGAGKSTLLKLIVGLEVPTGGTIQIRRRGYHPSPRPPRSSNGDRHGATDSPPLSYDDGA